MNIQTHFKGFSPSSYSHSLIQEKISDRLDVLLKHLDPDEKIGFLTIEKDKLHNFILRFEMNLHGPRDVYATTSHRILKSGIIDLVQEVERQLEKISK